MPAIVEKLEKEVEAVLADTNFHLMEINCSFTKRSVQVRVFIDRDDGFMTHGDCIEISGKIKDLIDAKNLILRDYRLEVSSPGIGRKIKQKWEFEKNLEKRLTVEYLNDDGETKKDEGVLLKVGVEGILLKNSDNNLAVAWDKLLNAKVELPW